MNSKLFCITLAFYSVLVISCQKDQETEFSGKDFPELKAAPVADIFNYDSFEDLMDWTFSSNPVCPPAPDAWTLCSHSGNSRWAKLSWNWSACPLDPTLVAISGGKLLLTVPGAWKGGQVNSLRNDYCYGSYRAMIKAGAHSGTPAQGTCSAFFFYNSATAQEIDVEILNREMSKVRFVTHPGDNQIIYDLGKAPWGDFIEYGFNWYKNKVDFFVGGLKVGTQTRGVPNQRGTIMLNHWTGNPGWSGTYPPEISVMEVEYVKHAPFLQVTFPNKQDIILKRGSVCTVTWDKTGDIASNKVTLEVWKGGKLYKTIASRINNSGSFSFTIPNYYPIADNYRIKVKSLLSTDYYDFSDADLSIN